MTRNKSNGAIVYEGPSLIDGKPIVLILTGLYNPSQNSKTGEQIQSFIICQDDLPTNVVKTGADESICGDCPLRRTTCYVNLMPVNAIWKKYKEEGYPPLIPSNLAKIKRSYRSLRIGSYGDPTAIPIEAWMPLLESCQSNTGYTHAWRYCDQRWRNYLMASIERPADVAIASSMGWRSFRVKSPNDPILSGEIMCRYSKDSRIQCVDCGLCDGTGSGKEKNVVVDVHGINWKKGNFEKLNTKEI